MKLLNSTKSLSVVATAISTIAALGLSTSPAAAALFRINFCGTFEGMPGGVEEGSFVEIDTDFQDSEDDNFGLVDAEIKTKRPDLAEQNLSPEVVTYTFDDFTEIVPKNTTQISLPENMSRTFPEAVRGWKFENSFGNFFAVFPETFFPLESGNQADNNFLTEVRVSRDDGQVTIIGGIAKDKDKPQSQAVPEPLTILGSGVALGFGAMFKKEHSRRQKKTKTKA